MIKKNEIIKCIFLFFMFICHLVYPMQIDRVILATNDNPNYIEFWPIVAKVWKNVFGIQPTLALIGDENVKVDESLGDVIRFEPIPGIPTKTQAQTIRLLLPCLFEYEVSIISDIDVIPLNTSYIIDQIKNISDNKFVVYNNMEYVSPKNQITVYPMCYNTAKGSTFKEIFNIKNLEDIKKTIQYWYDLANKLASTCNPKIRPILIHTIDERMLVGYLSSWPSNSTRCVMLNGRFCDEGLIDKTNWKYDTELLRLGYYKHANLLRPYHDLENKKLIDQLIKDRGWENLIS